MYTRQQRSIAVGQKVKCERETAICYLLFLSFSVFLFQSLCLFLRRKKKTLPIKEDNEASKSLLVRTSQYDELSIELSWQRITRMKKWTPRNVVEEGGAFRIESRKFFNATLNNYETIPSLTMGCYYIVENIDPVAVYSDRWSKDVDYSIHDSSLQR